MIGKVLKNSLANAGGFLLAASITFFITPFLVHNLGKGVYGVWSILISLTGYFGLLDFGMRTAIVKYVAGYHANKDYEEMNSVNSTTWTLYSGIGLFSWAGMVVLSLFILKIFNLEGVSSINFTAVMFIIGADVFFTFFFMIYQGNIGGLQRYDIIFLNASISLLVRAGLIWYFLGKGHGIMTLSIVVMLSNLLGYLLNYYSFKTLCKGVKLKIGIVHKKQLKMVWQYSIKSFVINVSDKIIYYSDSIIIGIFLNPESVTFYAIASSLIAYLRQLVLAICGGFIPAVSEADAKENVGEVHRIVIEGTKLIMFVLVPVFCGLVIIGNEFIKLWMGGGFEKTYHVLLILAISQFLVLPQYGVAMALYGTSQHGLIAKINILVSSLNVVLAVLLVRPLGLVGVAVGSGVSMCILQLFLKPMLKMIGMGFKTFFEKGLLPFLKIGVLYACLLVLCKEFYYPSTWLKFVEIILLSLAFYMALCYYFALSSVERSKIVILFAKWRSRFIAS